MSHLKGTTLVESCLVVAIIGLMTMIAVPSLLRAQESYRLTSAARQISGKLHLARILSISRREDCRLRVTSPSSYLVECQSGTWFTIETSIMPATLQISANRSPEFHPRGIVAPTATITVRNTRGQQKQIIVNRLGRVRIQ